MQKQTKWSQFPSWTCALANFGLLIEYECQDSLLCQTKYCVAVAQFNQQEQSGPRDALLHPTFDSYGPTGVWAWALWLSLGFLEFSATVFISKRKHIIDCPF